VGLIPPLIRSISYSATTYGLRRFFLPEFQFQSHHKNVQCQADAAHDDQRDAADIYAVDDPQYLADQIYDAPGQSDIFGRPGLPGFDDLGQHGNRHECAGQKADNFDLVHIVLFYLGLSSKLPLIFQTPFSLKAGML